MPERRDIASVLADLRVSVAKIESIQAGQAETLRRLENKLDLGVFREEYERRHAELVKQVSEIAEDYQQRKGREGLWRAGLALYLAVLSGLSVAIALHLI